MADYSLVFSITLPHDWGPCTYSAVWRLRGRCSTAGYSRSAAASSPWSQLMITTATEDHHLECGSQPGGRPGGNKLSVSHLCLSVFVCLSCNPNHQSLSQNATGTQPFWGLLNISRSTKLTALKMDVSNLLDSSSTPPSPLTELGWRTSPNGTWQNGRVIQDNCRPSCDQVTQSSEETDLTSPPLPDILWSHWGSQLTHVGGRSGASGGINKPQPTQFLKNKMGERYYVLKKGLKVAKRSLSQAVLGRILLKCIQLQNPCPEMWFVTDSVTLL